MRGWRMMAAVAGLAAASAVWPADGSTAVTSPPSGQARSVALGVSLEGAPFKAAVIHRYSRMVGRRPRILMWYRQWDAPLFVGLEARAVRRSGATPVVTWEPWRPAAPDARRDPAFALRRIASGEFDRYIAESARQARRQAVPLLINFAPEMNGDWAPWGRSVNGNRARDYVVAYRRVVRIFRRAGASNVGWVWTPNGFHDASMYAPFYPGSSWVDWLGLDAYNWGSSRSDGWMSPAKLLATPYRAVVRLAEKPVLVMETASAEAGGDKAAWIRGLMRVLPRRFPRVSGVVWFERLKENDWRVSSSPGALRSFRRLARSPRFQGGLLPARPRAPWLDRAR